MFFNIIDFIMLTRMRIKINNIQVKDDDEKRNFLPSSCFGGKFAYRNEITFFQETFTFFFKSPSEMFTRLSYLFSSLRSNYTDLTENFTTTCQKLNKKLKESLEFLWWFKLVKHSIPIFNSSRLQSNKWLLKVSDKRPDGVHCSLNSTTTNSRLSKEKIFKFSCIDFSHSFFGASTCFVFCLKSRKLFVDFSLRVYSRELRM